MPPVQSSHTPKPLRHVIRISQLAYMACAFLLFAVSFPIFGWPAAFSWLLILPIIAVYFVARVRTTVSPDGLEVRSMFSSRTLSWDEVKGFRFPKRSWARAELTDGTEVTLPAVSFVRLPEIAIASGGRITDPYAAAADAFDAEEAERAEQSASGSAPEPESESEPSNDQPESEQK
ncbi:PH domain-containing protein [Rhodococcus sp. AD45-ID]|uniref:PH domain-containing protein n=1 Tax=Rhodococcus TaxID=1827 RepID=UPI0005D3392E|nr:MULTISPECIES: PH domain-containing protein [Rhodococcus]NRI69818.1 PH domain-containing protein [Rhodococcus sp. MS16]MCE4265314.1 PH domain-containing protein [Rhodococcus globerulus]MDV8067682.1 PH domain-containing protein [Rhodococcus sp. IEGM 1366]PSR40652.1 PH domain-containing protein [Rhodococcus sp. AD45-ID]QXW05707.1 PH domain-containing protein [Rhodococcus globerulus]